MINATMDLSAVVNAAEVMQATANTLQKISRNNRSAKLNRAITEFVFAGLETNLNRHGTNIFSENAPHVFRWSRVVDRTSLTVSNAKEFSGSRSSVYDMSNTFKPTVSKRHKLYELKLKKTSASAYIEFLENSEPAQYDSKLEAIRDDGGAWGEHHFKDQAMELEKVKTITKEAASISERRTNSVRKPNEPARIRQATNGKRVLRFELYQRDNEFAGKFQEAWEMFIQGYRKGEHEKSVAEANRVLSRAASSEVKRASQQSAVATLGMAGLKGGRMGSAGGVRFILGPRGGLSARFPDPKSSAGTKAKQKRIEKNATQQMRRRASQRRGS